MNKSAILAASLVLANAGPAAAQSSVQIYGVQDVFVGRIDNETATTDTRQTVLNAGGLTTSFIGFRGVEDLGGGLKALFTLETYVRPDTGAIGRNDTDPFFGRASWVGLESPYGRLLFGRMPTPYALATTNYTPLIGTTTLSPIFANVFRNNVQGDTRMNNSIHYRSPRWAGVELEVQHSLGQEQPHGPNHRRDRATDGALRYVSGALGLVVATRRINLNANSSGQKQVANMAGATYDFGFAKLSAQYHRVRDTQVNAARNARRTTREIGASVPLGNGQVLAEFASSTYSDAIATTPDKRRSYAVGYDYNLSKRTDVYLMRYEDRLSNPGSKQTIHALGIRHRF